MLLIKKSIINVKSKVDISFEQVASDLLMVSLINQIENQGIPSYWRLTKIIGIPPLEIGVNCQYGFVTCITFFVDCLKIAETEDITCSMEEGNILVDTSIFVKDNDYYDVNQSYDIKICKNKLICSFIKVKEQDIIAYRNDRMEIYVDSNNYIVGFSICELSEDEKHLLTSIYFGISE